MTMANKRKVYVLLDYAGRFYCEWDEGGFSLPDFTERLKEKGFEPVCLKYSDVDFNSLDFEGKLVHYSSSEIVLKKNLEVSYYKGYIEDILLGIIHRGGILIPHFHLFRAHHNKSFQEVYKSIFSFGNLKGRPFGTLNEFAERGRDMKYPIVIKAFDKGAGFGVFLARDYDDALRKVKKISSSFDSFFLRAYCRLRAYLSVKLKGNSMERIFRNNARKFVVQDYIEGLHDDWKVLVFGRKYYLLNRKVRENDFRASGSGKFSYIDPPEGLLDFAEEIFNKLISPYASLDIAFDGKTYYLIEFQGFYFGLYTVLNARHFFCREGGGWVKKPKENAVEEDMAEAFAGFVAKNFS
ncbi:MAG: hypothetical protein HY809_02280 [Nitrospirae bacterium]|nr:hypothetical protein [Nitrospirota bacterium]